MSFKVCPSLSALQPPVMVLACAILCFSCNGTSSDNAAGEPTFSESVPENIRQKIAGLRSCSAKARGCAADELSLMISEGTISTDAVPFLIAILDDGRIFNWMNCKTVGMAAASALTQIGAPAVVPLINCATNHSVGIEGRVLTLQTIGEIRDSRGMEVVRVSADSEQAAIRRAVADALMKFADPQTLPLLSKMLTDNDDKVRWKAAYALGAIRDMRSVHLLIKTLSDKKSDVRSACATALMWLTGEDYREDATKWRAWTQQHSELPRTVSIVEKPGPVVGPPVFPPPPTEPPTRGLEKRQINSVTNSSDCVTSK